MRFGLRELGLLIVLLSIPVASYYMLFKPQNLAIEQTRAKLDHKEQMLAKLRERTSRNADLARENEMYEQRILEVEAQLPKGKELDRIVRQVSDIARGAGLSSPSMQTEKPVQAALYMEQPLKITTGGEWSGFYRFLTDLERLPRKTRISSMTLRRDKQLDGRFGIDFTLSIYFQEERATDG